MKKLLNTLYITSPDSYLSLDGETVVVLREDREKVRIPLLNLESIVTFGYTGASPALMGACVQRGISICFLTASGRFLARVIGESRGNVFLRKEQYRISDQKDRSLSIAIPMIAAKLHNTRWVLERTIRDHPMRVDVTKLKNQSLSIRTTIDYVLQAKSLEELRGLEGEAALRYFSVFNSLLLQQQKDFIFQGRSRRPPMDRTNAMLSFCYTLLTNDIVAALESVGLDAYVGFLHQDRSGRASLALDMLEEFRATMVDRFIISLINKRMVKPSGFSYQQSGGVLINDTTRKVILTAWQDRKKVEITHPFLNAKIQWGLLPFIQATLLARYLRGDLDTYPAFLWK